MSPAKSEKQRRFMAMVHNYQTKGGSASPQVKKAAGSMTSQQSHDFMHKKGTGGAGGSPCKFRKREGSLEDKRIIHGNFLKVDEEVACRKEETNFD